MRRFAGMPAIVLATGLSVAVLSGCAQNSMVLKGQVTQLEQQKAAMTAQYAQLQKRADDLAKLHEEQNIVLAQARQETQLFKEQLSAVREQLRTVNTQLAAATAEKVSNEKKVQAVVADCMAQGVIICATNRSLPGMNNTLCFSPPLICTKDDIDQIIRATDKALTDVFG